MTPVRELTARYGGLAWKLRWWALVVASAICATGWIGVSTLPNRYEANARVYIDADAFLTPLLKGIAVESSLADELDLLQRMLLSRPNLERIIQKTDLQLEANTPNRTERLVESLSEQIKVVAQTRNIFSITYRNTSRQLAGDVVQAMLASFIENKAGDNRDEMDRASVFLDGQIAKYEQQLREAEQRRASFRKKYIDLLPADGGGANRLEQARSQVTALTGQLTDAQARHALLAKQLALTAATYSAEGGPAGDPHATLREAEQKLRELRQVYTDAYPDVITQKHLVESLRHANDTDSAATGAASSGHPVSNPVYEQFRLQLVETDAQIESLQRQIKDAMAERDRLEKIAKGVPELEAQYVNLNRDYDVVRKNYDELVARREGMRIEDAAQKKASNIKLVIIDPPNVPRLPVAPNRVLLSIGVLLAGLGGAAGLITAMIALDQSFHTVVELRSLGLPVIGSVSLAALAPSPWQRMREIGLFGAACAVLIVVLAGILIHYGRVA